jgi:hypothetical protein
MGLFYLLPLPSCYAGVLPQTRDSVVSIMTRIKAGRFGFRILTGTKNFFLSNTSLSGLEPPKLLFYGFCGKSGRVLKLITYLPLVPRLRMSGAIPLLLLHAFMT